jgi:hypothetical protein
MCARSCGLQIDMTQFQSLPPMLVNTPTAAQELTIARKIFVASVLGTKL